MTPRYDQISLKEVEKNNQLFQILSPSKDDQGVWIHQDAWFHLGRFTDETCFNYDLKRKGNGAYFFVLDGKLNVEGQDLEKRDGFGIWDVDQIEINASPHARVLVMEVPMTA